MYSLYAGPIPEYICRISTQSSLGNLSITAANESLDSIVETWLVSDPGTSNGFPVSSGP